MNRTRNLARAGTLGLVAAAVTLTLPTSAFAQRGAGGGFGQNPGMQLWMALDQRFDEVSKQLTFTEAQTESVKKLLTEFTEKNASVGKLKDMLAGMRARQGGRGGGGGGAGQGRARAGMQNFEQMRTLMQELGPAFDQLHEKVTELLDEEQKKSLTTLLQRRRPGG